MKNHIKSLTVVLILLAAVVTVVLAKANTYSIQIQNETTHNIGYMHVHSTDNSTIHINVTGQGNFDGTTTATPDRVQLNGYAIQQGTVGTAIDANNDTLSVDFTQSSSIVVIDQSIVQ